MKVKQQQQKFYFLPFVVLGLAICFLIVLISTIKEDVFYSGDAGLKFLMVKQVARGGSATSINLYAPLWVKQIWSQGFYPFKEPFVYGYPKSSTVSFPPAFQWLTSWLFKWFGFKGIYIIPILSIVTLWSWFILLMQKIKLRPLIISLSFIMFSFCSPLTIYGAFYWEHSLAVLLFFGAIAFVVTQKVSLSQAILFGLMAGTSVWFRPEMLLLCLLFSTVIFFGSKKNNVKSGFLIAMFTCITAFLIFNNCLYDNILGAHSYQLSPSGSMGKYLGEKFIILLHLNARLMIYFPLIVLIFTLPLILKYHLIYFSSLAKQLTVTAILFLLIAPFLLPNAGGKQWGPRYFLPVVPLAITIICLVIKDTVKVKRWVWITIVCVMIYSLYLNVYRAYRDLHDDYAYRVKPGMDFLRKRSAEVLVVQNQFIAQEFAVLAESRNIFLSEEQQSFTRLQEMLQSHHISRIIYIAHDPGFERMPINLISNSKSLAKIGDYYFAEFDLGK